jgi:hypothetical protein
MKANQQSSNPGIDKQPALRQLEIAHLSCFSIACNSHLIRGLDAHIAISSPSAISELGRDYSDLCDKYSSFILGILSQQSLNNSSITTPVNNIEIKVGFDGKWLYKSSELLDQNVFLENESVLLPFKPDGMNRYLPEILGKGSIYAMATNSEITKKHSGAVSFGSGTPRIIDNVTNNPETLLASIEYGFISSFDIALNESRQQSLIICPGKEIYYKPGASAQENILADPLFKLTPNQDRLSHLLISLITETGITKYNNTIDSLDYAVEIDDSWVIIVDQRLGDKSLEYGSVTVKDFERMLADALKSFPVSKILIKIHPDALSGKKDSCITEALRNMGMENKFQLLAKNYSPKCILSNRPSVYCAVSQFGFEALMYGCRVYTYGNSFYSGYGLTTDRHTSPLARPNRSLRELVYLYMEASTRYYTPATGSCFAEDLICYLAIRKAESKISFSTLRKSLLRIKKLRLALAHERGITFLTPAIKEQKHLVPTSGEKLSEFSRTRIRKKNNKICFLIPSSINGASAIYILNLSRYLRDSHSVASLIITETKPTGFDPAIPPQSMEDNIYHYTLMSGSTKEQLLVASTISEFDPRIVVCIGSRFKTDAVAFWAHFIYGLKIGKQFEDDDYMAYTTKSPVADKSIYALLDNCTPSFSKANASRLGETIEFAMQCLLDPNQYRWVEPWLRHYTYSRASLICGIWEQNLDYILQKFSPSVSCVLPPVSSHEKIEELKIARANVDRLSLCKSVGLDPASRLVFLGGTVYDYTDEFTIFLKALASLDEAVASSISIIFVQGRTNIKIADALLSCPIKCSHHILHKPTDTQYDQWLVAADCLAAPGDESQFNRLRLPSRLVKGMLIGIPVYTYSVGFGSYLKDGYNALLTTGSNPSEWAESFARISNVEAMNEIGQRGREFAEAHFDINEVGLHFYNTLSTV